MRAKDVLRVTHETDRLSVLKIHPRRLTDRSRMRVPEIRLLRARHIGGEDHRHAKIR